MKAIVDSALCNGCEVCSVICPEVFRMDRIGGRRIAAVRCDAVTGNALSFCRDAMECCRTGAILLVEGASGMVGASHL
jgi:ferredoxin